MDRIDARWKEPFQRLIETIEQELPPGFAFQMQDNMPAFVVPLDTYPRGYHAVPGTPLPWMSLAAQKNHIALYHMGIYVDEELRTWFKEQYPVHMSTKLNMGKSCIRFTNPKKIPYTLVGELASKREVEDWIQLYEGR